MRRARRRPGRYPACRRERQARRPAFPTASADLPAAIAVARGGLRDDRDRALAAEIAAGVQRWRAALDHVIVAFAKRRSNPGGSMASLRLQPAAQGTSWKLR